MDSDFFRAKKDVIYNVSQKLTAGLFKFPFYKGALAHWTIANVPHVSC